MRKILRYTVLTILVFIFVVLMAFLNDMRHKHTDDNISDVRVDVKKKESLDKGLSPEKAREASDYDIKRKETRNEGIYINQDNELIYTGTVNLQGFSKLKLLYDSARIKPTVLVITSTGGSDTAGVEMGFWVHENKISVEVPHYCGSACANFVFTAGKQKTLGRHALLIWHGGSHQPNLFAQVDNISNNLPNKGGYQAAYKKDAKCNTGQSKEDCKRVYEKTLYYGKFRESLFFYKLGVDQNLPYYGQLPHYTRKIDVTLYAGFYYSLEDLKQMGISNIHVKGRTWEPELNHNSKIMYKAEILKDIKVRTDADLGMEAFREILQDYIALHGANYTVPALLKWYRYESVRY